MRLLLALLPPAAAFCGTYIGDLGEDLANTRSQIIIAREGQRTTLTLSPDVQGSTTRFGMLLPVPEVLLPEDVTLASAALFGVFGDWSVPRLVSYDCGDFYQEGDSDTDADTDADADATSDGVTVESTFSVGAYDLSVLSATGADGLTPWLQDRGFVVPDSAAPILQGYIDAGQYFLAAQVDLQALPDGGYLPPLQFGYDDPAFSVPIRLGTTVSTGEQDLLIYVLAENTTVGVANYDEAELESDCMVPPGQEPDDYYAQALDESFSRGVWLKEYMWWPMNCDPCASEPPTEADILATGYKGDAYGAHFTRLHLRYTPEEATQDLMLYPNRDLMYWQVKYVTYDQELESTLPICGGIIPEEPGTCPEQRDSGDSGAGGAGGAGGQGCDAESAEGGCDAEPAEGGQGCGGASRPVSSRISWGCGGGQAALPGVGLLVWRRRKRNHL